MATRGPIYPVGVGTHGPIGSSERWLAVELAQFRGVSKNYQAHRSRRHRKQDQRCRRGGGARGLTGWGHFSCSIVWHPS